MLIAPTQEDFDRAIALLEPERLLMVRKNLDDLDQTMRQELNHRLQRIRFPIEWASRLQSILLMLHEARLTGEADFISKVFLPWIKFRNSLTPSLQRVGRAMARISDTEAGSIEETEHFIAIYRLVVSDVLDPYLTLLAACHQFIDGTYVNLESANHLLGEFNKVEYVQAAMRRRGDTASFFRGYNPKVRNAISHAGSHGVTIEDGSVLFRDIRRGGTPIVSTVRWSVEEVASNGILLVELVNCIDAATEVFGLDCVTIENLDFPTTLQFWHATLTPQQRAELRASCQINLREIWRDTGINDVQRREILAEILTENLDKRDMALRGLDLSSGNKLLLIAVPPEGSLSNDRSLVKRITELTRYLIVARGIFGPFGEQVVVAETDEQIAQHRLLASVPSTMLDEYADENVGLLELLQAGSFALHDQRLDVTLDEEALAEAKDHWLGPAFI